MSQHPLLQPNPFRAAVILAALLILTAACNPSPPSESPTVEPGPLPSETEPLNTTATPIPVGTLPPKEVTKTPTLTPYATPTIEFCETIPIEYLVIVDVLNIRADHSLSAPVIGRLTYGARFVGTFCLDRYEGFDWTAHPGGGWVAYRRVADSYYFME